MQRHPSTTEQAIADAAHGLTRFFYDGNGNLTQVVDTKGQATNYTYDSMDRLATRKDALNRTETYQYDPAGNLMQFTDRKAQPATFTYDALNRRTRADYADGSFTIFIYDAVGRLSRATDSTSGPIDFFYDTLDRLILELTQQGAVAYEYDAIGRRTKMTVAGQAPVAYQYDAASRLIQVAQGSVVVTIGYDAAGRRTSLTYSNGVTTTYAYDNANRLTRILHQGPSGTIEDLNYTYDAAGNRISLTRTNGTATNLPAAVQAAYDAANEQISFNSLPATFDANGNQTTSTDASGTTTYTWDARNRLTTIIGPGLSASFSYDALGRRVSKTINGVTTSYLYDGNDIMAEITSGAVGASYLRSLAVDEPFVRQTSSGNEFYHVDVLGSTLDLTNQAGVVQASYHYDAYGKTTISGTSSNPFQYTGRENDGTGLYYYRARYYSPQLQRFLREDLIGRSGAANLYAYVGNNPVRFIDKLGLDKEPPLPPIIPQGLPWNPAVPIADDVYPEPPKPPREEFPPEFPPEDVLCILMPGGFCQADPPPLMPPPVVGGTRQQEINPNDKADDLISGKLKRSKSYRSEYGDKTYQEIDQLASAGDQRARQMKKLIEQGQRLRKK